jgi:hypothetical protein
VVVDLHRVRGVDAERRPPRPARTTPGARCSTKAPAAAQRAASCAADLARARRLRSPAAGRWPAGATSRRTAWMARAPRPR